MGTAGGGGGIVLRLYHEACLPDPGGLAGRGGCAGGRGRGAAVGAVQVAALAGVVGC
jgi:hypothetical protein